MIVQKEVCSASFVNVGCEPRVDRVSGLLYFIYHDRHCDAVFSVNCVIAKVSVIDDEFFEIGVGECDFRAVMNLIMKGADVNIRITTGDVLLHLT